MAPFHKTRTSFVVAVVEENYRTSKTSSKERNPEEYFLRILGEM